MSRIRCFSLLKQELVEKAAEMPQDIRWRFIGHLQSNKVNTLLKKVPSLVAIETVDTEKLAVKLNATVIDIGRSPLDVFVQVNTSGEESKSGVEPGLETVALCKFIAQQCPSLNLRGLMTIGMPDYTSKPENFECLQACRFEVSVHPWRERKRRKTRLGVVSSPAETK